MTEYDNVFKSVETLLQYIDDILDLNDRKPNNELVDIIRVINKTKPLYVLDDNLCPRCNSSVHLLIGKYCQSCGGAILTSQNHKMWGIGKIKTRSTVHTDTLKVVYGNLLMVYNGIKLMNKYVLEISEREEILRWLDNALAIFRFNISENEKELQKALGGNNDK